MAAAARVALEANEHGERVTVVNCDAYEFLPPEPVDVVICEMLHTGLMREKQLQVIASFKRRYLDQFGGPLPRFVPEATLQAVQPVQQDFDYFGYRPGDELAAFTDSLDAHLPRLDLRVQEPNRSAPCPVASPWSRSGQNDRRARDHRTRPPALRRGGWHPPGR
jgi:hypothetical protein